MSELKVVKTPPNAAVDIVLVHGWHDNQQPWTHGSGNGSVFWPEKHLPIDTPRARILTFGYVSNIDHFWALESENLDSISDELFWELEYNRSDPEMKKRPIIFVAHSIGGLVCENGLVRANNGSESHKELANCVRCIAFLGTPFRGDDKALWAETAKKFFRLTGTARPNDLEGRSKKLAELGKEFPALLESRAQTAETRVEAACFYEGSTTEVGGRKSKIVEEPAARIPGCGYPIRLDANHQGLCVFESRDDSNYKLVSRLLARWARELEIPNATDSKTTNISHATFSGANNSGFQLGQNTGNLSGFSFRGGR